MISATTDATVSVTTSARAEDDVEALRPTNTTAKAKGTITGSAVALHCCKAHSKINRKMESSTSCKIVTPENFILKLGTLDYVEEVTYYTIFDADCLSGASPQIGEI